MKISLDSNAWEKIFDERQAKYDALREKFSIRQFLGFICETTFRIEAISKLNRRKYFEQPKMDIRTGVKAMPDGSIAMSVSFGPDDAQHPGLPHQQDPKLRCALAHNIKLMHGISWMGLPRPTNAYDPVDFVQENSEERAVRDQCRVDLMYELQRKGIGRSVFEEFGGWDAIDNTISDKKFAQACAEWADGELATAHIAYKNDVICTDDLAGNSGRSVFNAENREWLAKTYNVAFVDTEQLLTSL